jgi:chromosome partitioning protein
MKVYAFLNMKGGVGKTTSSLNVATGLAMQGYKTLLVDFDPQANTTGTFLKDDEYPSLTIEKLIFDVEQTKSAIMHIEDNLDLLPSSIDLAETELGLCTQKKMPQHNRLRKIIEQVNGEYDYVIIDCQPIINTLTVNVILVADKIIIPIKPEKYALNGFKTTIKNISELKENFEAKADFKVLITMKNKNNADKDIVNQLRELSLPIYSTEIRYQAKPVSDAANNDRLLIKEKANVAQDYKNLVAEIMAENNHKKVEE